MSPCPFCTVLHHPPTGNALGQQCALHHSVPTSIAIVYNGNPAGCSHKEAHQPVAEVHERLDGVHVVCHMPFCRCRLLEETITDPLHLQSHVRALSGAEYLQVHDPFPHRSSEAPRWELSMHTLYVQAAMP